jgi:hypothetical protein
VPNLIGDYADALLAALKIRTPDDAATFLRRVGREGLATLHVAYRPGPLPPYYGQHMELSVEIDRGDVWYDFPFDDKGKPMAQPREFPDADGVRELAEAEDPARALAYHHRLLAQRNQ